MSYPTVHPCKICDAPTVERRTFCDDGPVMVSWRCACGHIEVLRLSFSAAAALSPAATAVFPFPDDDREPRRQTEGCDVL